MKIKRRDAIGAYQGFMALERGPANQPYDLAWETWDKVFHITGKLSGVFEAYNKTRQQRFMALSGGKPTIDDAATAAAFQMEDEDSLNETISVSMPKVLLTEDEMKTNVNKIPPSVRLQIKPFVQWNGKAETDGDEDSY